MTRVIKWGEVRQAYLAELVQLERKGLDDGFKGNVEVPLNRTDSGHLESSCC